MQHDVIIACDFKSAEDTFRFLDLFKDEERKPFLKIGMELTNTNRSRAYPDRLGMDVEDTKEDFSVQF